MKDIGICAILDKHGDRWWDHEACYLELAAAWGVEYLVHTNKHGVFHDELLESAEFYLTGHRYWGRVDMVGTPAGLYLMSTSAQAPGAGAYSPVSLCNAIAYESFLEARSAGIDQLVERVSGFRDFQNSCYSETFQRECNRLVEHLRQSKNVQLTLF